MEPKREDYIELRVVIFGENRGIQSKASFKSSIW